MSKDEKFSLQIQSLHPFVKITTNIPKFMVLLCPRLPLYSYSISPFSFPCSMISRSILLQWHNIVSTMSMRHQATRSCQMDRLTC